MKGLLERQAVLAELTGLARRVARGGGRLVLLRGEAGVGKTAVIAGFLGGLDVSVTVLRGWCDPLAAPRPLGPLVDTCAQLPTADAAVLAAAVDAGDTAALYRRLLALFGGGRRWVWVIEDVHWADEATLDLMRFLARRIDSLPLLLVLSYRGEELGQQHPLTVALGDIATCAALTRVGLEPLSREAVAVLAAGSGINAGRLHQLTGGNPFFVTEVVAAGRDALSGDALPRSVAEAVRGRLGRLSAVGRDTAHAVAVCVPRPSPALVQNVCPAAAAGLPECLGAGVLVADGDVVGFRHELARRAALDQIPPYERRLLHKRAMAALAEPPVDPDVLAALLFHADRAGDRDTVLRHGPGAADRAASLGAHREAAELYALVLGHADGVARELKAGWLERQAFESYLCGQVDPAVTSWREAITLRHALGDRLEEGDDWRLLSQMLLVVAGTTAAAEAGLASVRLLESLGPSPQLAWSLINMAQLSAMTYDPGVAGYVERAITLGTQLGEDAVVIRAHSYATLATVFRADIGWDRLEGTWRETMNDPALAEHAAIIGTIICWTAALHHDLDRAERYIAQTRAFCAEHDMGSFQTVVIGAQALVELHRGDWARAAACADDVLTRPELSPQHRNAPLVTIALIRARRGQQPVTPLLDEATAGAQPDEVFLLGVAWAARAEAAWLAGDDDTARTEAQAGLAAATEHADPWLVGHLRRWVYLAGGPTDTISTDPLTPYDCEISGYWQAAAQHWTDRGCPYDAAIAQLGGDTTAVQSALATFHSLDARAAARRARQRLAELRGASPRGHASDTSADPDRLTRRERQVADLLAAGRSDNEIAIALHISPKTVGHHVGSILAKLGVDNRVQAATHLVQRQQATAP